MGMLSLIPVRRRVSMKSLSLAAFASLFNPERLALT
jgi:hypothetical protein